MQIKNDADQQLGEGHPLNECTLQSGFKPYVYKKVVWCKEKIGWTH